MDSPDCDDPKITEMPENTTLLERSKRDTPTEYGENCTSNSDYLATDSQLNDSAVSTSSHENICNGTCVDGEPKSSIMKQHIGSQNISTDSYVDGLSPRAENCQVISEIDLSDSKNVKFIIQNYQSLKQSYEQLQIEHQTLLDKEKEWFGIIRSNNVSDEEAISSLSQVNKELREQLQTVLGNSKNDKICMKRLESELKSVQEKYNTLKEQLNSDLPEERADVHTLEKENIALHTKELEAQEKLNAHDLAAKKTISALKKEMTIRIDELTSSLKEITAERDNLAKVLIDRKLSAKELEEKLATANKNIASNEKEINLLKISCKEKNDRLLKLHSEIEEKEQTYTKKEEDNLKKVEELDSLAMKVKWAQNKLRQELEAHKETKKQLAISNDKCNKTKEEASQVRQDCQEMIKKYQDSEEMKSIQLIQKLKDCNVIIGNKEKEIIDKTEIQCKLMEEVNTLKSEHQQLSEEVFVLSEKLSLATKDLSSKCVINGELEEKLKNYTVQLESLKSQLGEFETMKNELTSCQERISQYQENETSLKDHVADIENMLNSSCKKEAELLSFTEKLSENNAATQAQVSAMETQMSQMSLERTQVAKELAELTLSSTNENDMLQKTLLKKNEEIEQLRSQLNQEHTSVSHLTSVADEYKQEVHLLKKKHSSTIKDLQRQLHQTKRKIDQIETTNLNTSQENLSTRSITSSNSSLDKINSYPEHSSSPTSSQVDTLAMEYSIVQPTRQGKKVSSNGDTIDIDKHVLVDRICRLQKAHAKKNEKLDFLEEHVNTLVEELQKKTKIIQYYFGREDSGSLAPDLYDKNKLDISKRGGIMASLYSSRPHDKDMTLDLSLQINTKLQTVLEDLILKNITLKENIDTLSKEVERLQKSGNK